jgi:hypothetical protein
MDAVKAVDWVMRLHPRALEAIRLREWVAAHCGLNPHIAAPLDPNAKLTAERDKLRGKVADLERQCRDLQQRAVALEQRAKAQPALAVAQVVSVAAPAKAKRKYNRKARRKPRIPAQSMRNDTERQQHAAAMRVWRDKKNAYAAWSPQYADLARALDQLAADRAQPRRDPTKRGERMIYRLRTGMRGLDIVTTDLRDVVALAERVPVGPPAAGHMPRA